MGLASADRLDRVEPATACEYGEAGEQLLFRSRQ